MMAALVGCTALGLMGVGVAGAAALTAGLLVVVRGVWGLHVTQWTRPDRRAAALGLWAKHLGPSMGIALLCVSALLLHGR